MGQSSLRNRPPKHHPISLMLAEFIAVVAKPRMIIKTLRAPHSNEPSQTLYPDCACAHARERTPVVAQAQFSSRTLREFDWFPPPASALVVKSLYVSKRPYVSWYPEAAIQESLYVTLSRPRLSSGCLYFRILI